MNPIPDAQDRNEVCEILRQTAINARPVHPASGKRCDLHGEDAEGGQYLIEIKSFHDDKALWVTMKQGKMFSQQRQFDFGNGVEDAINEGVKQLDATPLPGRNPWRILVLRVRTTFDADLVFQQILGALYGKRSLLVNDPAATRARHLECLYFSESAFYRHRRVLDGALVIDPQGLSFWLNDYSSEAEDFRNSVLGRFFAQVSILNDAPSLEAGGMLVANTSLDRKRVKEMLVFVKEKYRLDNPILMSFKRDSAAAPTIPRDSAET